MHPESYAMMDGIVSARKQALMISGRPSVLDYGSQDVNGCYRPLFESWSDYVGADMVAGRNVDLVVKPYEVPLHHGKLWDVILCGQVLEHVEMPWDMVRSLVDSLRGGGIIILVAPWRWEEHRFPLDCWRIMPDGMKFLLESSGCAIETVFRDGNDTWGIGQRITTGVGS